MFCDGEYKEPTHYEGVGRIRRSHEERSGLESQDPQGEETFPEKELVNKFLNNWYKHGWLISNFIEGLIETQLL